MRDNSHLVRARSKKGSQIRSEYGSDREVSVTAESQGFSDLQDR